MDITKRIIEFVTKANWTILFLLGIIIFLKSDDKFTLGFLLGGLIVIINFHILKKTVNKHFQPISLHKEARSILRAVIIKYYIRFIISGFVIFLLIAKHIVNPLGLILGLSIVVVNIILATMLELKRLFFKEAV